MQSGTDVVTRCRCGAAADLPVECDLSGGSGEASICKNGNKNRDQEKPKSTVLGNSSSCSHFFLNIYIKR
jgi:hypothetical protein